MWPRILLELLPHLTRLAPAADKFFASRNANEQEKEQALAALAGTVRTELHGVNEEQTGLRRQLLEQGEQVAQIGLEVTRARLGIESVETRVAKLEQASRTASKLLVAALVLLVGVATLAMVILVKQQAH